MDKSDYKQRIVNAFSRIKEHEEGIEEYRPSPKTNDTFDKAVALCLTTDLSPEEFVEAQYANKPDNVKWYPNMLLNKQTVFIKEPPRKNSLAEYPPENIVSIQKKYLTDAIYRRQLKPLVALMDDSLGLQPWFRIVITDTPVPDVIAKYKQEAKRSMFPALYDYLVKNNYDVTRLQ
jgi:uncharacterized protein YdhG (YjbR/CyaY superfamily)